jgi:hypothetical protein
MGMDLSVKSLATAGVFIGCLAWFLDDSTPKNASRKPSASFKDSRSFKKTAYKPKLDEFSAQREEEVVTQDDLQEGVSAVHEVATEEARPSGVSFENLRLEITQHLSQGDVDSAVNYAEKKLEESLASSSSEMSSIGYLHEFIMQHVDDPEEKINVTMSALKGTQDANVRRYIYERFQRNSPDMMEELDGELDAASILVE